MGQFPFSEKMNTTSNPGDDIKNSPGQCILNIPYVDILYVVYTGNCIDNVWPSSYYAMLKNSNRKNSCLVTSRMKTQPIT